MDIKSFAFTTRYTWIANVLTSNVKIKHGFDSSKVWSFLSIRDTWATSTCITQKVVDELWLMPTGKQIVWHAWWKDEVYTYIIDVLLPNSVTIQNVNVSCLKFTWWDVLVWMDIIWIWDFAVTQDQWKTIMSYIIPSQQKPIDYVSYLNKTNTGQRTSQNRVNKRKLQKKARRSNRK